MDEKEFRNEMLDRTMPFLTPEGSKILRQKTVAIAGCGGVGGNIAIMLARLGIGGFLLADPGIFDLPDMNRQYAATNKTLGKNKAEVYEECIHDVNPYARVKLWKEGVQENNVDDFLNDADLLIDGLDLSVPVKVRVAMFEKAQRKGIHAITSPVLGFGALVACSDPEGMSLAPLFGLIENSRSSAAFPEILYRIFMPEHLDLIARWLDEKKVRVPSTAVAPMMASCIVATESLNALIGHKMPGGRKPLMLPRIFLLDMFRMSYVIVNSEFLFKK